MRVVLIRSINRHMYMPGKEMQRMTSPRHRWIDERIFFCRDGGRFWGSIALCAQHDSVQGRVSLTDADYKHSWGVCDWLHCRCHFQKSTVRGLGAVSQDWSMRWLYHLFYLFTGGIYTFCKGKRYHGIRLHDHERYTMCDWCHGGNVCDRQDRVRRKDER